MHLFPLQSQCLNLSADGEKTIEGRCAVGHYNKYGFIMMHFAYSIEDVQGVLYDCFMMTLIKVSIIGRFPSLMFRS